MYGMSMEKFFLPFVTSAHMCIGEDEDIFSPEKSPPDSRRGPDTCEL